MIAPDRQRLSRYVVTYTERYGRPPRDVPEFTPRHREDVR